MSPWPRTAFDHFRPPLLEILNGLLQVIYLKTEVIDGALLFPNHTGDSIPALARTRVANELDHRVADWEKSDLGTDLFDFFHLRARESESFKSFDGAIKFLPHNPDVTYLLQHDPFFLLSGDFTDDRFGQMIISICQSSRSKAETFAKLV